MRLDGYDPEERVEIGARTARLETYRRDGNVDAVMLTFDVVIGDRRRELALVVRPRERGAWWLLGCTRLRAVPIGRA